MKRYTKFEPQTVVTLESDRFYIADGDLWVVHKKHRQLLKALYALYRIAGERTPRSVDIGLALNITQHAEKRTARYTAKQGRYLAFIHQYTSLHGVAPAER